MASVLLGRFSPVGLRFRHRLRCTGGEEEWDQQVNSIMAGLPRLGPTAGTVANDYPLTDPPIRVGWFKYVWGVFREIARLGVGCLLSRPNVLRTRIRFRYSANRLTEKNILASVAEITRDQRFPHHG